MKKYALIIGIAVLVGLLPIIAIGQTLIPGSQIARTWKTVNGIGLRFWGASSDLGLSASGKLVIGGNVIFQALPSCIAIQSASNGALSCNNSLTNNTFGSGNVLAITATNPHGDLRTSTGALDFLFLKNTEVDSEAELEALLTDVTDVFTNNDGALDDDDVTLLDVQTATSNDFHSIGGVDANTTYTAGEGLRLIGTNFSRIAAMTGTSLEITGSMSGKSLYVSGSGASPLFMTDQKTGNVGIGTASPHTAFHILQQTGRKTQMIFQNPGGAASDDQVLSFAGNDTQWNIGQDESDSNKLKISGDGNGDVGATTYLTMNRSGYLGIGTDPAFKLNVEDNTAGVFSAYFENGADTDTSYGIAIKAGNNAGDITPAGALYILLQTPDGDTVGSVTQAGTTSVNYNTTSDERLKEHIVASTDGLSILNQIQVRDFEYIGDAPNVKKQGFVAQELYQIYPEAVSVGTDERNARGGLTRPWGIDYGKLTPLLVKSVQELNAKVEMLQAQVDQLSQ